jgi:hypothetical protein
MISIPAFKKYVTVAEVTPEKGLEPEVTLT